MVFLSQKLDRSDPSHLRCLLWKGIVKCKCLQTSTSEGVTFARVGVNKLFDGTVSAAAQDNSSSIPRRFCCHRLRICIDSISRYKLQFRLIPEGRLLYLPEIISPPSLREDKVDVSQGFLWIYHHFECCFITFNISCPVNQFSDTIPTHTHPAAKQTDGWQDNIYLRLHLMHWRPLCAHLSLWLIIVCILGQLWVG